ncbi:helix-turn-helix domain-containing protein [Roseivivax sp. CAU 1761]
MAVQKHLAHALKGFGADYKALDAARVFRIAGTTNSKADASEVRPVWPCSLSQIQRYDFDDLAHEVLPLTRGELVSLRAERAKRRAERETVRPQRRLDTGTLWETYLTDLQRLRQHRWWGDLPAGQRDAWLFVACNAVSWLTPAGQPLLRETYALAQEAGGWSEGETKSRMSTIYHRAAAAARGEKIEWQGRQVDPRYRFRADTIIEWLEISPQEMREAGLTALVDDDVKRERDRERKRRERCSDDKATAKARLRMEALQMHAVGYTQAQIAGSTGVTQRTIGRWISDYKKSREING